jgi:saccharopine dehydrogenase-like NADP-dependent oxidoreductase
MKKILFIGAGRSASSAIKYLLDNAEKNDWMLRVGDMNENLAIERISGHSRGEAFEFNALDPEARAKEIQGSDFVISMLPARFHIDVAKDCIKYKKDVITPSYVSADMKELHDEAVEAGIIIMNEIGVDPGIDHMSAKKVLDEIEEMGGEIHQFESFTGGLLAPQSENNPWKYKFTWNPRNVVLAGQGGAAKFIHNGKYKYVPYTKLFRRTEFIDIEGYGRFEGYANRDSLKYRETYGLENIDTIYRGTLRRVGFCRAWDVFVQLGCTDDSYTIEGSKNMTKRDFINSFLRYDEHESVELKLRHQMKIDQDDTIWEKLEWLGIFEPEPLNLETDGSPAQILQKILMDKWTLEDDDKDMIVMWHKFGFTKDGVRREIQSSMGYIGKDDVYTAMADTVGLPVAICSEMILNGTIKSKGVQLPLVKDIYEPVLNKLQEHGVRFSEKEVEPTES